MSDKTEHVAGFKNGAAVPALFNLPNGNVTAISSAVSVDWGGSVNSVDVCVVLDGKDDQKWLASEIFVKPCAGFNDRCHVVYLLDGMIAVGLLEHQYFGHPLVYQAGLDKLSEHLGGERKYLANTNDDYQWVEDAGVLYRFDTESPGREELLRAERINGEVVIKGCGVAEGYSIHPDYLADLIKFMFLPS